MENKTTTAKATFFAITAAALYALSSPFSKMLLEKIPSTLMAGFLYLGAGLGIFLFGKVRSLTTKSAEQPLTKQELPYVILMVLLDIAAPVFLMIGLTRTTAANASLLNNFEIVATSLIALLIFKEAISARLWIAIVLVTLSSAILSFEDISSLSFSWGSILVLCACVCWGFENNCTRKLSSKDPLQIVVIKGFGSGLGALALGLALGQRCTNWGCMVLALALGFVAYGLSIYFYIYAQRYLGAAKTSTYYAVSPFIGVALSMLVFRQKPSLAFVIALLIMVAGSCLATEKQ
ncbi:MAG: DMT family transporter [Sphaerochaetaceae bacterium]|nr:DMT family transporter [Sphaerochaetaceae bacterium]